MNLFVSSYESFATLDGEGIRFEIFFQGCPLRCVYCHNPETWESKTNNMIADEILLKKILRFSPYFGSNGGVTLSGGEPLIQSKALIDFSKKLKQHDINISLDTSGCILNDDVKDLLSYIDTVILDLKFYDDESYKKYANGDFKSVIQFLDHLQSINKSTVIKTVIVPNLNDSIEILDKYVEIIKRYSCIRSYELLGFHTMGFSKYEDLKLTNPLLSTPALSQQKLNQLQEYIINQLKS